MCGALIVIFHGIIYLHSLNYQPFFIPMAKWMKAPAYEAGDRRFKSFWGFHFYAGMLSRFSPWVSNPRVGVRHPLSAPLLGPSHQAIRAEMSYLFFHRGIAKWAKAPDFDAGIPRFEFESCSPTTYMHMCSRKVRPWIANPAYAGSNPVMCSITTGLT